MMTSLHNLKRASLNVEATVRHSSVSTRGGMWRGEHGPSSAPFGLNGCEPAQGLAQRAASVKRADRRQLKV
jgi:hypothetical protein